MGRIAPDTLDKLSAFIESLPEEARGKCALCNETLVHIVKKAEAETGAGTATVTRALAEKINDGAVPGDRVSSRALDRRVRRMEDPKIPKRDNKSNSVEEKPKSEPKPNPPRELFPDAEPRRPPPLVPPPKPSELATEANQFATMAITNLERIRKDDPKKANALLRVKGWINTQLKGA
jgi:hypothetical protein